MKSLIDVALKREKADLVLKNCKIANVFTHDFTYGDIAIKDGYIAGIGEYDCDNNIDMVQYIICPGFIDAHMHIESSFLTPSHFASAAVPFGTTTCVADPHEIANVAGLSGVQFMIDEGKTVPLDFKIMLPSCVPATPFEHNGATIDGDLVDKVMGEERFFGLGEFMNAPGVLFNDEDVMKKISAAKKCNKNIDGHYPGCGLNEINAYIGVGISTDHECVEPQEARMKMDRGMYIQMREGSAARNLNALLPIVNEKTMSRCLFCTDDKQVDDMMERGHISNNIKMAIEYGIDPIDAISIATLNPSVCYNMNDRGAIAPGRLADIVVIDNFDDFNILEVYKNGKLVAKNGKALFTPHTLKCPKVHNTINFRDFSIDALKLRLKNYRVRIINMQPHNLTSTCYIGDVKCDADGYFKYSDKNISKIVVVERHKATGNMGIGLIKNYDIKNGAIAISVAHDSHNIIAVGDNDEDIYKAIYEIKKIGGGMTAVHNGEVFDSMALPIGGLMSDKGVDYVRTKTKKLNDFALDVLKVNPEIEPFMSLSFMSLVVIPELKINDTGLFDLNKFDFVPIEAE